MTDRTLHDAPEVLTVAELFAHHSYRVPLYQRAYAWTSTEVDTLLIDIRDARLNSRSLNAGYETRDYYIGSVIVDAVRSNDRTVYEVVDGQQRLTTLFIILALTSENRSGRTMHKAPLSEALTFEGRDTAGEDLRRLARDGREAISRLRTDGIKHVAELVEQAWIRGEHSDLATTEAVDGVTFGQEDSQYLLQHVKLLRTALPPDTDLNHYFEVMNTRGEQLEKHEILKGQLLGELSDARSVERDCFSLIWDACSVLDRHLQTQFSVKSREDVEERRLLFGDQWNSLQPRNAQELFDLVERILPTPTRPRLGKPSETGFAPSELRLLDILDRNDPQEPSSIAGPFLDQESGSYGSIIDFPNLLLHVLRLHRGESFSWEDPGGGSVETVRLEDKHLLAEFQRSIRAIRGPESRRTTGQWVRDFAYLLLKTRFLLDTYVIRTQPTAAGDDEENWVIHRAFRYAPPSMRASQLSARSTFRPEEAEGAPSTDPQRSTHRRVVMLQAMFQVSDTRRASKYFLFQILEWLNQRADSHNVNGDEFAEELEAMARSRLRALDFTTAMNDGTHAPNFLFNVLDYELWRLAEIADSAEHMRLLSPEVAARLKKVSPSFRFRYRTSVEHFYPVQPSAEQGHRQLAPADSNSFGNLCIMSRSENSRRNNLMPIPKAKEFAPTLQSLKFQLMSALALQDHDWEEKHIRIHGEAMLRVLENAANSPSSLSAERWS